MHSQSTSSASIPPTTSTPLPASHQPLGPTPRELHALLHALVLRSRADRASAEKSSRPRPGPGAGRSQRRAAHTATLHYFISRPETQTRFRERKREVECVVVRGVKAQLLGEVVAGRNCAQEACKVRGRVEREVRRKPEEELEERRQRERVRVRERRERKRRWEEWERQRAERAVEEVKKEEARIRALKSIHEEVDELQASFKATIGESAWHNIWGYPSTGLPPWVFDLRGHWKTFLSGMPWAYFIENIENEQDWKEGMTRWWARQLDDVIARELRVFVPDVPRAGSFLNGAPTAHDIALVAALGGREMEMERWEGRFKNVYTRFAVAELGGLRVEVGDGDVLGREDGWQKVRGRKVDEACVLRG